MSLSLGQLGKFAFFERLFPLKQNKFKEFVNFISRAGIMSQRNFVNINSSILINKFKRKENCVRVASQSSLPTPKCLPEPTN